MMASDPQAPVIPTRIGFEDLTDEIWEAMAHTARHVADQTGAPVRQVATELFVGRRFEVEVDRTALDASITFTFHPRPEDGGPQPPQ